jgi:glycosyltransferase involved in cell wall biosynthesis
MYAAPLTSAWGARDFVAVARRMRAKGTPVRFVLVGAREPQNPDSIGEAEMARWLAEGAIEWWRDPSDRPAVFRQADIFCLPPHSGESVPNVLVEAAASGLPIVTTDTPGGRQVVRQGANGLLVALQRDDALEAALARLIGDPEFRRIAGKKSREIAVAEFSLDAVHTVGLAVYCAASGHALVGAPSS